MQVMSETKKPWSVSDLTAAKYLGLIEFQTEKGEWENFELYNTPTRVVFGGACNAGFLESGFIEKEDGEDLNETLQELLSDLQTFYNDGPQFTNRIVFNERM